AADARQGAIAELVTVRLRPNTIRAGVFKGSIRIVPISPPFRLFPISTVRHYPSRQPGPGQIDGSAFFEGRACGHRPALLCRPPGDRRGPLPALLLPHGAPLPRPHPGVEAITAVCDDIQTGGVASPGRVRPRD